MRKVRVSIHRFGDSVAVSFLGADGETVYLDVDQAALFALELQNATADITMHKFSCSNFGTRTIEPKAE